MTSRGEPGGAIDPDVEFGDTWTYESIVGAFPVIDVSGREALAVQFVVFEVGLLVLAAIYDLWAGAVAGTVAVLVAVAGSAAMLNLGGTVRSLPSPPAYRRLLFGSSIEIVLGLLAYLAFLTYLFVYDPRDGSALLTRLLGERPPLPAVYLMLLILWDVVYRIGTGWWAAVAALYRSVRYSFDPETARAFRRLDLRNAGFALVQLALVPLVWDHPILIAGVVGHVIAVALVVAASVYSLSRQQRPAGEATRSRS